MMMMRVAEHLRWLEIWSCRRTLSQTVTDEKTPQTCHTIRIFHDKDNDYDKEDDDKKGKYKDKYNNQKTQTKRQTHRQRHRQTQR